MCTARPFSQGVNPFALKFYLNRVSPSIIFDIKNYIALPCGKDRIPLDSLVLTQYRSVTDRQTDGRTGGQTDMPPVAYTALAKLALRCAVTTSKAFPCIFLISIGKGFTGFYFSRIFRHFLMLIGCFLVFVTAVKRLIF